MKIFCMAWKTSVMPVFAYWYYHEGCYDPYAHERPDKVIEVREVAAADLLGHADCCGYHASLNAVESEAVG